MGSRRVKTMKLRTRRPESGRRSCSSGSCGRGACGVFRVIAVALAAIIGGAVPCSAGGLVIEAPNLTATAGSSGSFDLLLVNTNSPGGTSYDVAGDQFKRVQSRQCRGFAGNLGGFHPQGGVSPCPSRSAT